MEKIAAPQCALCAVKDSVMGGGVFYDEKLLYSLIRGKAHQIHFLHE
ncbi:MAG: hypothetical protein R6X07_09990 [Desulfatiglandales bacterium]